ncbi:hypothetical protein JG688_00009028 [Phytophthora aleatoria]|uniref:Protein kinase domain-containing protein n=1 Tax=Phytophthora aleatoria TaxID=2496075 RepID=A0A8J5IU96_9STRA|nr:hypothetical protein JG688_00009028 [Phytophthora aleatoria]
MPEQHNNSKTKNRHVSKPAAARDTSPPASAASSVNSSASSTTTSHRRDLLDGSIQEISRKTLMERFHKRGRVESASYEQRPYEGSDRSAANTTLQSNSSSFANTDGIVPIVLRAGRAQHHGKFLAHKDMLFRPQSAPNLTEQTDDEVIAQIFPDICPRELRIAEVKSWECSWMNKEFPGQICVLSLTCGDDALCMMKDVPVYGRGQRRQMVRELHALYSNLVPMADNDNPVPRHPATGKSTSKPKAKYVPQSYSKLPSPYIVSFYDAFVDRPKNSICMVMEYMTHIHNKRMVHRDIKPHNLLTNRQGEVKISDFGLARTLNDNSTSTKTFVGTLLYMAPERIGGGDYSYPADIWSFGLALISVALGRYPLPTQDGFFGLVDSVSNEQCLKLPAESFSEECRSFTDQVR